MKKILTRGLLCLPAFFCVTAYAQNTHVTDSLFKELSSAGEDTNKVNILDDISYEYAGNSYEKSIRYANLELELSRKLNYKLGEANALNAIGMANEQKGNFPAALEYYLKSQKVKEETGNSSLIIKGYNNIANIYLSQGDYDNALRYFFMILDAKETSRDKRTLGNVCNNIGIAYKNKKEYAKSIQYHLMGLEARKTAGFPKAIGGSYNNLGVTYQEMKQYDKAIAAFNEALKIRIPLNDLSGIASTYINLGKTYNQMKAYAKALPFLTEGERYALRSGNDNWRVNAYGNVVDSYEGLKDYRNENIYLLKYIELNDSIFNKEKSAQIIDMQTKYETEKKESENQLLTQQNQIQQLQLSRSHYVVAGISVAFLSAILITLLFIRQSRFNQQQQTMQLEQKLLRSQMNPHFIFNSLIAIESYIYKNDPKEAGRYLSSFAKLMRLILENSREEYIPLAKEIKTLEYYLQLQKNRFDDSFDYVIELEGDIDPDSIAIPPMLAQPFIENSIEHGLRNAERKGEIRILFRMKEDQLIFEVKDNGVGLERSMTIREQEKEHRSMATVITMERLTALNRKKKNKIRLLVDELKDSLNNVLGTKVCFAIPFKQI